MCLSDGLCAGVPTCKVEESGHSRIPSAFCFKAFWMQGYMVFSSTTVTALDRLVNLTEPGFVSMRQLEKVLNPQCKVLGSHQAFIYKNSLLCWTCPWIATTHNSCHCYPNPAQPSTTHILLAHCPQNIIWDMICVSGSREGTGVLLDSKMRSSWEGWEQVVTAALISRWQQLEDWRDSLVVKGTGCFCISCNCFVILGTQEFSSHSGIRSSGNRNDILATRLLVLWWALVSDNMNGKAHLMCFTECRKSHI